MNPYKIYAWGWTPNADRLDEWRDKIPGLGIIHYSRTYHLARPGDIAFVNSTRDAKRAVETPDVWSLAIIGDERNVTGPSGTRETAADYRARLREAKEILESSMVKTASAGLAMAGGGFDYNYQAKLSGFANIRAQNFRPASYGKAIEGIESIGGKWFVTEIPVRANWWPLKYNSVGAYLWQSLFVFPRFSSQLKRLMAHSQVEGVGIWCLREGKLGDGHWQGWHGLVDRNDNLTWQGRLVRGLLEDRVE